MSSTLVTGGTGSFGQAFVRRLLLAPDTTRVCIFSRGEHAQAAMRSALDDDPRLRWFIGDVRDKERLIRALQGVEVVVHAAAQKRVESCEYNPGEMTKTNVFGAMNVIEAAATAGVAKVVALSTDKACGPINAYGHSKALAECLFLASNGTFGAHGPRFAVTRYGNVANSNGSLFPKWKALIALGATEVPVTDPECTRFYMTLNEAVDLVLATIESMPTTVVIPDWLPAYRLSDVAQALKVGMRVTGLPNWEKRHETMNGVFTSEFARRMTVEELREVLANDSD